MLHGSSFSNATYNEACRAHLGCMSDAQESSVNVSLSHKIATGLSVPWSGFVGSFLYYALLTALMLGGLSPERSVVAVAYVAPVLAYSVVIAGRFAGQVVARIQNASARGLRGAVVSGA